MRNATTGRQGDGLDEYARRRSFEKTPEPRGEQAEGDGHRFVVQEHHARRLHWDLRLEHEGVLVSWALPRGIPDDPEQNRLAVHTEDHPVEYLTFEGEIPSGEYGAGSMTIWDSGTYELEKFEEREVIVRLHGDRARGKYALFRTRGKDWLIHRMDPPEPGDPVPPEIRPMTATLSRLPQGDGAEDWDRDWGFEIKWDGVRAIGYGEPGRLRLVSRNLRDITGQYPEIGRLSRDLGARRVVLDGELVALDAEGRPSFQRLQRRMHVTSESEIRRRQREVPVTYVLFDLLYLDGRSLLDEPYRERRRKLEELGLEGPSWRVPAYQLGDGAALLAAARDRGLEGIIAKQLDSLYQPGHRTRDWLKIKNVLRQEVVIGGWVPGEGRRAGQLGALLTGYYEGEGEEAKLRYAGKVGTGFDAEDLRILGERLEPLRAEAVPFTGRRPPSDAVFVKPALVCEVEFAEWTSSGTMRHPSYEGLREDKPALEVVREEPAPPPAPRRVAGGERQESGQEPARESTGKSRKPSRRASPQRDPRDKGGSGRGGKGELMDGKVEIEGRELRFSNLDKVLYPETGTTKGDVIQYYRDVAYVLLPHLQGRPLTMKRYPDGVEGKHFYEKQCPSWRPDWVSTAPVWSDRKRHDIEFCVIDDLPTLLWAANLADLELHTMLATAENLDRPTMLVFDLDPGEGTGLAECSQVALWLREMFSDLGLDVLVKSSGSKGLHLHLPLNTELGYDETKPFAHAVAGLVERHHPDEVISTMSRSQRRGKVFIDWSQNTAHKTTVVPFSLRARAHPTVATPLTWKEVAAVADGSAKPDSVIFEAATVVKQLDKRARLIRPLLEQRQQLPDLQRPPPSAK